MEIKLNTNKAKSLKIIGISIFVMIFLPFSILKFSTSHSAMAFCMLLFYVVNHISSMYIGLISGNNAKNNCYMPPLQILLFLLGIYIFFTIEEKIFIFYAIIYLVIAYIFFTISHIKNNKK